MTTTTTTTATFVDATNAIKARSLTDIRKLHKAAGCPASKSPNKTFLARSALGELSIQLNADDASLPIFWGWMSTDSAFEVCTNDDFDAAQTFQNYLDAIFLEAAEAAKADADKAALASFNETYDKATATQQQHETDKAETDAEPEPKTKSDGLTKLTVPELTALYVEELKRTTGSTNARYLIWKIREARKGNVKSGPRKAPTRKEGKAHVLPLRVTAEQADDLDTAYAALGFTSRTAMLKAAIGSFLASTLQGCPSSFSEHANAAVAALDANHKPAEA